MTRLRCPHRSTMLAVFSVVVGLLVVTGLSRASEALTFDVAADFSATNNPNGVWTYAFQNPDGSFGPLPSIIHPSGVDVWFRLSPPPFTTLPQIAHNSTAVQVIFGTAIVAPGAVTFHPGVDGTLAVIRFTAPLSADYDVDAFFRDAETNPNIATVSVVRNGSVLLSQNLGIGTVNFDQGLTLVAGDTLDFRIAAGPNSFFNDNKRIGVTITAAPTDVPQPSGLLLTLFGVGVLSLVLRRQGAPKH